MESSKPVRCRKRNKKNRRPAQTLHSEVTDWEGWFCICLWSCVLEHPALRRWRSLEGSSAEENGRCWLSNTAPSQKRARRASKPLILWRRSRWIDERCAVAVTWYSVLRVLVSLEASCSIAWVSGREEVWSSWSHTSLGVVTEHMVSTPKVLTSNSSDRLEPLLQNKMTQVLFSVKRTFIWCTFIR